MLLGHAACSRPKLRSDRPIPEWRFAAEPRMGAHMANAKVNDEQRDAAMAVVRDVETRVRARSGDLAFASLRKVSKELVHLERDSPAKRKRVKRPRGRRRARRAQSAESRCRFAAPSPTAATKGYVTENL